MSFKPVLGNTKSGADTRVKCNFNAKSFSKVSLTNLIAVSVSNKFNIGYHNKSITITFYYKGLEKHYIYYLVKLIEAIKDN